MTCLSLGFFWAACFAINRSVVVFWAVGIELTEYANSEHKRELSDLREVASQFGAHAFELRMLRREKAPAKILQWLKRADPRRLIGDIQRRGLWGTVSLILAALTCYGTLALVGILSAMGIGLAVNETLWAGGIILFAVVATAVIALGMRKHGSIKPLALAIIGSGILIYTMYVDYSKLVEAIGFILLAVATWMDFDGRRWARVKRGDKTKTRDRPRADLTRTSPG